MKITLAQLEELNACEIARERFQQIFGDEVELDDKSIARYLTIDPVADAAWLLEKYEPGNAFIIVKEGLENHVYWVLQALLMDYDPDMSLPHASRCNACGGSPQAAFEAFNLIMGKKEKHAKAESSNSN